jgi:hypothetical protein
MVLSASLLGAAVAIAQTPPPPEAKPSASDAAPAAPDANPGKAKARRPPPELKAVPPEATEASPLAPLAWLEGCWRGTVNRREYREHWMPLRGKMLVGMSQTVTQDKTQDYEYLRLESRPDGVYYVALPSGQRETAFKFAGQTVVTLGDRNDDAYTFINPALEFPQKLTYRRATEGWLYVSLVGNVKGVDREVTYPMRRIDCQSGENIAR